MISCSILVFCKAQPERYTFFLQWYIVYNLLLLVVNVVISFSIDRRAQRAIHFQIFIVYSIDHATLSYFSCVNCKLLEIFSWRNNFSSCFFNHNFCSLVFFKTLFPFQRVDLLPEILRYLPWVACGDAEIGLQRAHGMLISSFR